MLVRMWGYKFHNVDGNIEWKATLENCLAKLLYNNPTLSQGPKHNEFRYPHKDLDQNVH